MEVLRIAGPVHRIEKKHPAEEEKLREEKEPHPDFLAGIIHVLRVSTLFASAFSSIFHLFRNFVCSAANHGDLRKILRRRWRGDLPLQGPPPPGIGRRLLAFRRETDQIGEDNDQTRARNQDPMVETRCPGKYSGG